MTFRNVIDTDDLEASGFTPLFFPGGEPYVKAEDRWPEKSVHIHAKIRTWNDAGILSSLLDVLTQQSVTVSLFLPYLPGARADHRTGLAPLSGRMYRAMFSQAQGITVLDPHSKESIHIWAREGFKLRELNQRPILREAIVGTVDYVVCPDAGAIDRANDAALTLFGGTLRSNFHKTGNQTEHDRVLYCTKKRDAGTGLLSGFNVPGKISQVPDGSRLLIVDDICDGGGTFIGIKEAIHAVNDAVDVELYVTHGIFSKGTDVLWQAGFNRIYTTDSWFDGEDSSINTVNLLPHYFGGITP